MYFYVSIYLSYQIKLLSAGVAYNSIASQCLAERRHWIDIYWLMKPRGRLTPEWFGKEPLFNALEMDTRLPFYGLFQLRLITPFLTWVPDHRCGTETRPTMTGKKELQVGGKFVPKWEAVIERYFRLLSVRLPAEVSTTGSAAGRSCGARVVVTQVHGQPEWMWLSWNCYGVQGPPFMVLPGTSTGSKYCVLCGVDFDEHP